MLWARIVGALGIGFFLASAFTPIPNLLNRRLASPPRLEPADAIVVLGAGVWKDHKLSSSSLRRTLHGIVLHRRGLAPLLVFSGPGREDGPPEAQLRADLARELGTPTDAILTEANVWTTREEALHLGDLLRQQDAQRILLVTDSRHMVRAGLLFERAGFEVLPAPADDISPEPRGPEGRLELMRRVLQELFGQVLYRASGYL